MIKSIINTFYNISKRHKLIRSFVFNKLSKSIGSGEQNYPMCFLEEPIYIGDATLNDGSVTVSLTFDIIMLPQAFQNYNVKQLTNEECESISHSIALNYVAFLNDMYKHKEEYDESEFNTSIHVLKYNFLTLRNFFDDAASGIRCSLLISVDNPISYCDLDEHFDENKEFDLNKLLSDIETDDAEGCSSSFDYKLPTFKLD